MSLNEYGNIVSWIFTFLDRLMRAYSPVPSSWYIVCFALSFLVAFAVIEASPLQLPAWGLALAISIAIIFLVPVGIIYAISGTALGNVSTLCRLHDVLNETQQV